MKAEIKTPEHGLYTAEIRLTKECNLRCIHCSARAGSKGDFELGTEETKEILRQLAEMGALYVVFTGGEPLLRKDLIELVKHSVVLGLRVSVDSNGTLLSAEKASMLKDAGVSTVQVSIDGSEKLHNAIRGDGAFERAVEGLTNSVAAGIYTTINFTISKINMGEIPDVVRLAEEIGVSGLTTERFAPIGRGNRIKEELLQPEEFKKSLEEIFAADIRSRCTDPLGVLLRPNVKNSYTSEELRRSIRGGCTAGIAAITISYDGEVYPCPKLEVSCGNIRDRPLLDIWLESDALKPLRYRRLKGRCKDCGLKNICGGCRAVAYAVHGDYLQADPTCFIEV